MTRIKKFIPIIALILSTILSCASEPVFHTVSYDSVTGTTPPSVKILHGDALGEKNLPLLTDEKGEKQFTGWYLGSEKIDAGYRVKKDIELQAGWQDYPRNHEVSYNNNSHGEAVASITVKHGHILQKEELPTLEDAELVFVGWRDEEGKLVNPGYYKVVKDLHLSADWVEEGDLPNIRNLGLEAHENSITLSWENPGSENFDRIKLEIRDTDHPKDVRTIYIEGKPGEVMQMDFPGLTSGKEYSFRLYPVFKDGRIGERFETSGIPSPYVGKTVWVKGVVPPEKDRWLEETGNQPYMVYWQEGDLWSDINKTHWNDKEAHPFDSRKWAHDTNLCWAAGASNTLHWWLQMNKDYLDRYGKYEGPDMYLRDNIQDNYPHASPYQPSEIFQYFIDNTDDEAGFDEEGVQWFIAGGDKFMSSPITTPLTGGGFLKEVFKGHELTRVEKGLGKASTAKAFIKGFDRGEAINYTASLEGSLIGHVMSIWGAEFDQQGYVSYLYCVDNNPDPSTLDINGLMKRWKVEYRQTPEGGTYTVIENGTRGYFRVLRSLRFTSLGTEIWEEYFRNNP